MKKILKYSLELIAIILAIYGCTPNFVDVYQGPDLVHFMSTEGRLIVHSENPEMQIEIGAVSPYTEDRTFTVAVDQENSSAVEGVDFELLNPTVSIPAGEVLGSLSIQGIYEAALPEGKQLNLMLTEPSHGEIAGFENQYALDLYKFCDFDLEAFVGSYNVYEHSYWGEYEYSTSTSAAGLFSINIHTLWEFSDVEVEVTFGRDSTNCFINDQYFYTNEAYGTLYIQSYEDGVFNSCTGTIEGLACYVYDKETDLVYDITTFDLYREASPSTSSKQMSRFTDKPKNIEGVMVY